MTTTKEIANGKLTVKTVKSLSAKWGIKDFIEYNDDFVRARSGMKDKLDRCYCCNLPFQINEEKVNLVCFTEVGNKTVCADCFEKLNFQDSESQ